MPSKGLEGRAGGRSNHVHNLQASIAWQVMRYVVDEGINLILVD